MVVKISRVPKLCKGTPKDEIDCKYSYDAVLCYMTENDVCGRLDRDLKEVRRKQAMCKANAHKNVIF